MTSRVISARFHANSCSPTPAPNRRVVVRARRRLPPPVRRGARRRRRRRSPVTTWHGDGQAGGRRGGRRRGVSASQASGTAHWKRAPARVRRWLMPTTLAPAGRHLARAEAGEAHEVATRASHHAAAVHDGLGHPEVGERRAPTRRPTTTPPGRCRRPRAGRPAAPHVDPHGAARLQEHGAPAAAAADDLDAEPRGGGAVDDVVGLGRAEHERRPVDLEDEHRPLDRRVEGGRGGRCRAASTPVADAPRRPHVRPAGREAHRPERGVSRRRRGRPEAAAGPTSPR